MVDSVVVLDGACVSVGAVGVFTDAVGVFDSGVGVLACGVGMFDGDGVNVDEVD
ncbi:MAG: hypothetical protein LBH62_07695 [Nitrososphaerota archaeon]|nr:hypothetical protein [Nitrososphaerota archaeon]